ncbi:MAG: NUDIX domain-containing protein [Bacteroidota bacterium]
MAYCIFQDAQKILLVEDTTVSGGEAIYRPVGGKVAFGEYSWESIRRQIKQVLGKEIKDLSFLAGPSEVVTELGEEVRHEIVFMFKGTLKEGEEPRPTKGDSPKLIWKSIKELKRDKLTLYPEDLLELL